MSDDDDIVIILRDMMRRTGADNIRAADEIERLRIELRRFQRIVIDHELLSECDDLCLVLCAGPCQGFNTGAPAVADTTKASTE